MLTIMSRKTVTKMPDATPLNLLKKNRVTVMCHYDPFSLKVVLIFVFVEHLILSLNFCDFLAFSDFLELFLN